MIAAIYSRKSKFSAKGDSIENQVQMCKDYANNQMKDKQISQFIIYEDEGFSGKNTNRPEFLKLLRDINQKRFDILICYRLDRISRNVADFSSTLDLLQKQNIDFVSIREQFDTRSPMGRAMIYIASVFAQLERETIAERIRDNMIELAKSGRWLGGIIPIGYESRPIVYIDENVKERKMVKLIPNPDTLDIVKLIYNKYLDYRSLSSVETYLFQSNIKTKKGSNYSKSALKVILTNPVYVKANKSIIKYLISRGISVYGEPNGKCGILTYNKQKTLLNDNGKVSRVSRDSNEWIAACSSHKGIIEADKWLMVQEIIKNNKYKYPNQGKTNNALLTSKLKCPKCGGKMQIAHGHISRKTGEKIFYYQCSLKKNSKGCLCNNSNLKVSELDKLFMDEFSKHLKEKTITTECLSTNEKKGLIDKLIKEVLWDSKSNSINIRFK